MVDVLERLEGGLGGENAEVRSGYACAVGGGGKEFLVGCACGKHSGKGGGLGEENACTCICVLGHLVAYFTGWREIWMVDIT